MGKIIRIALMTLFHVVVFVVIHDIGVRLAPLLFGTVKSNLHWGITVRYSLFVFGILSLVLSVFREYLQKNKYKNLLLIGICGFFCGIYIVHIDYTPYRTLLLLSSSIIGFIVPIVVYNLWSSRIRKWVFRGSAEGLDGEIRT